jgi:hypothetical protein
VACDDRGQIDRHGSPAHVIADRCLADPRRLAAGSIPRACIRRSASRIYLVGTRSASIGHSLVARKTDQLIRLATGASSTPPSPAVRNHRIAARLAPESVSALHRIPHILVGIHSVLHESLGFGYISVPGPA